MKSRIYLPFLAFAILIVTIALSCGGSTAVPPTVTVLPPTLEPTNPPPPPTLRPTNPPPPLPTSAPLPTDTIAPTEAPTYFTDDFSGDLSNWSYYVKAGNEDKLTISTDQGGIVTRLDDVDLAVYFYYEPYLYKDVILDLTYRNQGRNSNNVNVVCRYSDAGWYEFTVQNDGLYQIWAFTDKYHMLASGGSTQIKQGQDSNEITVGCVQNVLTLFINGVEIKTISDSVYFLGQGQVGFGVNISAMNPVTPVIVSFDTFTIAEPK